MTQATDGKDEAESLCHLSLFTEHAQHLHLFHSGWSLPMQQENSSKYGQHTKCGEVPCLQCQQTSHTAKESACHRR